MKRSFSLRQRLVLVGGLGLIAVSYGLVRLAYGLFLPDVQDDLGLSASVAGGIASGASAVYCVGAVLGFLLAGRTPRVLVAVAALVAAGGAIGMSTAAGPVWFGIASVVGSASAGIASPALVRIIAERFAEPDVPRAQAVVNAGTGPGLVVAGMLALVLLPDWRTAWAWSGAAGLVVGAVLLAATGGHHRTTDTGSPTPTLPGAPGRWRTAVSPPGHSSSASAPRWSGRTVGRPSPLRGPRRRSPSSPGSPSAPVVQPWCSPPMDRPAAGTHGVDAHRRPGRAGGGGARTRAAVARGGDRGVRGVRVGYTSATGALIARSAELDAEHAAAGTSVLFVALVLGQAVGSAAAGMLVDTSGYPIAFVAEAAVTAASAVPVVARRRSEQRTQLDLPVARR